MNLRKNPVNPKKDWGLRLLLSWSNLAYFHGVAQKVNSVLKEVALTPLDF